MLNIPRPPECCTTDVRPPKCTNILSTGIMNANKKHFQLHNITIKCIR